MIKQMVGKLAPAKLPQISVARGLITGHSAVRHILDRAPNLGGTDLSEMQVRREALGAGNARPVAPGRIILQSCFHKVLQLLFRAAFARLPAITKRA